MKDRFETIGVFVVLLCMCCPPGPDQKEQCVFQRENVLLYGLENRQCQMSSQSHELGRIPRAARSSASKSQLGAKADSEREQHQPRKVLCTVGVACLRSERVQGAIMEGMIVRY